jgi:hypothetical protein
VTTTRERTNWFRGAIAILVVCDAIAVAPFLLDSLVLIPFAALSPLAIFAASFGISPLVNQNLRRWIIATLVYLLHAVVLWTFSPNTNYFGEGLYWGGMAVGWISGIFVLAAGGLLGWRSRVRGRYENRLTKCFSCGYNLVGSLSSTCPECGVHAYSTPAPRFIALPFRQIIIGSVIALASDILFVWANFRKLREVEISWILVSFACVAFGYASQFKEGRWTALCIVLAHVILSAVLRQYSPGTFWGSSTMIGVTCLWTVALIAIGVFWLFPNTRMV